MTRYGPVALPATFTNDHFARVDVEAFADVEVISSGSRIVKLTFNNVAALRDYVTDARYYSDEGIAQEMRESGCGNISKSAARALERIEEAGLLDVALSSEAKDEYMRLYNEGMGDAMKELFASINAKRSSSLVDKAV